MTTKNLDDASRWRGWAAIGTDGKRPVVWGLGNTRAEAELDALQDAAETGVDPGLIGTVRVSHERAARIAAGDVSADDLVRRVQYGIGVRLEVIDGIGQ